MPSHQTEARDDIESRRKSPPRTTIIMIQLAHSRVRSIVLPRQMIRQHEAKTEVAPEHDRALPSAAPGTSAQLEGGDGRRRSQGPSRAARAPRNPMNSEEPAPERLARGQSHEAHGDGLAGVERVPAHLQVQIDLEERGDGSDPEEGQTPFDEQGRAPPSHPAAADGPAQAR